MWKRITIKHTFFNFLPIDVSVTLTMPAHRVPGNKPVHTPIYVERSRIAPMVERLKGRGWNVIKDTPTETVLVWDE